MYKIVMVPASSSRLSTGYFPGCVTSLPTASTMAQTCVRSSPNSATGPSRLSDAPLTRPDFNYSHGDGSSNEPSLGSIETAAWPRISRLRSRAPKLGFTSPPCSSSLGDYPDQTQSKGYEIQFIRLRFKHLEL